MFAPAQLEPVYACTFNYFSGRLVDCESLAKIQLSSFSFYCF